MPLEFSIVSLTATDARLHLTDPVLVLAGYAGRDQTAVRAHVQELLREGVPAPDGTPTYYFPPEGLLTFPQSAIPVSSPHTSGEIEPVLIFHQGKCWMTLGSDHTDRKEEQHSVPRAKALGPKVVACTAWPWEEVKSHWDQIQLSALHNGLPYQRGAAADLLVPDDHPWRDWVSGERPLVFFLGTVPTLRGFAYSGRFSGTMEDPVLHRTITLEYSVKEEP